MKIELSGIKIDVLTRLLQFPFLDFQVCPSVVSGGAHPMAPGPGERVAGFAVSNRRLSGQWWAVISEYKGRVRCSWQDVLSEGEEQKEG